MVNGNTAYQGLTCWQSESVAALEIMLSKHGIYHYRDTFLVIIRIMIYLLNNKFESFMIKNYIKCNKMYFFIMFLNFLSFFSIRALANLKNVINAATTRCLVIYIIPLYAACALKKLNLTMSVQRV